MALVQLFHYTVGFHIVRQLMHVLLNAIEVVIQNIHMVESGLLARLSKALVSQCSYRILAKTGHAFAVNEVTAHRASGQGAQIHLVNLITQRLFRRCVHVRLLHQLQHIGHKRQRRLLHRIKLRFHTRIERKARLTQFLGGQFHFAFGFKHHKLAFAVLIGKVNPIITVA